MPHTVAFPAFCLVVVIIIIILMHIIETCEAKKTYT